MEKQALAQVVTHYLSLATIIGGILIILFACNVVYRVYTRSTCIGIETISKYILSLGFFSSLGGTMMSLFYSDYLFFIPCSLCWYQRIFLYSQIFLFGLAWYKKDRNILPYSLLLSVVGFVIAIDHHFLQIGYNAYAPCSTAPFAVDCAKPSFMEFGFVTFPLMSAVLFGFLIVIAFIGKKFSK